MAKIKQSKLNEIKGYNEYKKRKEEKEQKAQKEESAAQAASPSTSNTKTTSSTTSNKTNTTSNKTSTTSNATISSTTKGAKIKQSKLDSIKGYNAYKARREARERNAQVPPNSTPVADKTKLNDGYTIESIRENLGYSQTALEDSIKRLEESKNVLTSSENEVTNFLKKYGATADDIHSKMATKYGAKLDTSGKYIFEDEQSYSDYQKEIAALGALYDQYNANMNQYNALYTQYQDSAVNYEDWYGRLEGYQPRDATLKDLLWNSLKQGYYNSIYGQESYKQMLGDENQAAAYKELLSGEDYQFETDNWLEKAVSGAANQLGQQYRQWTDPRSLASGTAFATGAAVLGQTGPQIALPEEVITVPGAFITGMQAGSAASNFEIEGGLAYQEMLEQGISPEVARIIGLSVGGGNAALEALQADELIKGLKVFNNKQGYESVAELLYAELKRRFPNLANQVIQEVAQEGVTIGGTQLASYIDKGELAYTMPETLQRLGETALSSTLTFGLMDVPGATMNVAANKANVNRLGKIGSEYNVDAEAVIAEGLEMPKNTEAYKTATELKAKVDAGQTVSDAELGRAVVANEMAIQQNQVTDEAAQPTEKAQKALENLARDAVAYRENFQQAEPTQSETVSEQATVPYNVMADTNPVRQKKVAETRSLEKKLGYGEEGLKLFKEIAAETNVDTDELMVRFDTPYQAGLTGLPMAKANLVDNFQTEAYNAGRMDNIARMAKDKESKPATIYSEAESGFDFTNAPSDLTQEQKDFAVFFNKAMGVKGEFNGYEGVNYNAKYSKSTGVVAFAQDFGIDSKLMKKLGSMEYQQKVEKLVETRGKSFIFYFAHEVADHVASNRAPAAMRAFNNAMYNYQQSSAGSENLARSKQAFYGDNKVDLSTEGAIEEVGADSILMLYDGDEKKFMDAMTRVLNGNDKQAKEGAKLYKNKLDEIIQKLKAWFRKLTGKENAEARANLKQGISELEQLRDMFEKAIGESAEVVKRARANREVATVKEELGAGATIQRNKNGELLLAKSKDNSTIIYSLKTYQDGGKDKLREALLRNGHTRTEIDSVLELIDDAADYLTILAAGYAKSHNYTALHDHLIADITTNVKTGKQVMSALVNNGDYPVNFDMALICKKRIAYMTLMTRLIEDGIFDLVNFKGEAIADVNDILRANNFETACLGCFVESRRLQFQAWAETIVSEWNAEVDKRKKNAKEFGFSKGRVKLTDTEMDFLQNELKNAGKKNKQGNLNLGKGSAQVRIGRLLDMVPSLQQRLTVADLLTPNGLAALREYDANLFSIVKSRYGAASPKIVQDFNPYASEIAMMTFKSVSEITSNAVKGAQEYIKQAKKDLGGIKKMAGETDAEFRKRRAAHNAKAETEAMRRYLYDIGGARIQSFSDFMIENVFDYLQIMADLSANRFPLHGYTKENICLRLFGMTGAKWNGSLIAHVERSMGKEYAGLLPASAAKDGSAILVHTEDGDYAIGFDDYARNKATGGKSFIQSIGMKDIIAVQLDPRYSKNVGSITIGVSDKQILAMLDSPLFSMVIPYHASGMLPGFARRVGVDMYNDYTDYQNTSVRQMYDANGNIVESLVNAKGDTIKIDTSYAFNAEVQKTGDARTAANNYIKWCAERHPVYDGKTLVGYATFSPKFSNSPYGTDFSRHPNYYKLLADFNTYDCITGESAVQGAVTMTFPSENNRLTASEMEAYKQRLRDTGVFSEKEIAKYEAQANKTFKDLVNDELKGRADYKVTQDAKWEKTVKEIKDKLMSDHARTAEEQFSLKDSQGNELTQEQAEYFKDSKVRDKYGNLIRLYHGTEAFGFTKLDFDKSDDGISFFMTDSPDVASSYSGTSRMRSVVKVDNKLAGQDRIDPYEAPIEDVVDAYNAVSLSDHVRLLSKKEDIQNWADHRMEWARREIDRTAKMLRDLYDNLFSQKSQDEKTSAYIEEAKEAFRLYHKAYQLAENATTSRELAAVRVALLEAQEDEHSRKVDNGNYFYSMFRSSIRDMEIFQDLYQAFRAVRAAERGENLLVRGIEYVIDEDTLREDLEWEYQTSDEGEYGNYELYANLTNPLIIEALHANWNSITIPGSIDRYEFEKIAGNKRFNEAKTRDFAKYAKAKNYDGVIFKDLVDTGSQGIGNEGASTVVIAFDSNQVKDAYNKTPTSDPDIRYSLKVTDEKTLDFLNEQIERGEYDPVKNPNGGYIKVYRSFQVINGKLYAPMNAVDRDADGKNHRLGYNSQYGVWEMSTESPEIAQRYMDAHPDAPYAMFDLDGVDNKTGGVAYNPYLHASNLVLNDQFSAAYRRNLITVECYVPISEANGAYRAQYAKDATGWVEWKPGGVAGKLMKKKPEYTRKLFVSRYMLPVREVPSSEVASMYKEYLDGTGIKVPWNVVTPDLRRELVKAGVPIDYDKDVYQSKDKETGEKKYARFDEVFPGERQAQFSLKDQDYMKAVNAGDMETAQRLVDEAAKAAGYTEEVFHGMGHRHNVYKSGNGQYGEGVYFTYSKNVGEVYGAVVDHLYVKVGRIADYADAYKVLGKRDEQTMDEFAQTLGFPNFDEMIADWDNDPTEVASNPELIDLLMSKGFEGFIDDGNSGFVLWDFDGIEYRIKSADPVTYDDAGNVIPLSKRFDSSNPDIRYSLKGEHEMRREIDRIRKEGTKAGKSRQEIENEVMGVVGPEYGKLLKTYGEIKRGERPYREISVPRLTEEDRNVSKTIRTILEAEATPDAAIPTIQEMITKGDFSYDVYTDKEARAAAEATIRRKGYETALADWLSEVKEGKVNKTNTALGWELYNQAATKGDLKTAMSVLNGMVQHQRNAAQALQATRILKKMAPDAQLYGIQRSVESLQEDLAKKYGDKVPDLKVDEELAKKLLKAKTDEERDEATKEIYIDIGRQMPSTFIDKWNAWRYLAMLGNPRTHVRNVVGNLGFAPVVAAKDLTATFIESVVSFASKGKLDRTKAMPNAKLLKAAWADYANVADEVTAGGKYSDSFMQNQYIQEGREIFKFKPLEKARKGNSAALEMEDMWFAQPHYAFALAQYCKAHGVTVEQLKTGKALGNARNYAIREAQKATYRDTNAFSQMVSELGRYSGDNKAKKGLSLVTEGILPFRKTPANILVRGIEYSPIGLLNGIKQALWDVSKGTKTGAEAIDSIAAGATGTVLLGLGVYLASQGLIRGAGGDDEKEKKFEELQGHQTYALELPNGKSITLDWLAPEVLPLFIGVNLCEMAREDKGESNLSDILTAVSNVTEPLLEMSCLQSLNDLFDSVGYAASGGGLSALPSILASAATSYLTQAFPTILGQAERSAQDERMTTYTEKNGFLTSDLQYTIGKISAKIPGWDFQQIPYVDAWGRTESTGSRASNIANNFLNPAYTSRIETSEMEEELQRLHDEKGDEYSVLPSRPNKYFNVDGDRKDLTAEEYVAYATEKGQLSYDILTDLTGQKEYDKLPDAEKARAVEMAYEYANAIAKSKVSDYEPDSWVAKALEAEEFSGMDETEYILYKVALSMADQDNNGNNNYDNTEKAAAIASMPSLSDADIAVLLDSKTSYAAYDAGVDMRSLMGYIGEGNDVNVEKLIGAKEAGISEDTYFKYTDTLKAVDQPNSNGELGGAATNAEKAAAIAKMQDLDNEGIAYLWGTDQAHEAYSYGVDMKKYAQFKGVVGDFKGQDKQQQIKSYLKSMNLSAKDYLYLYGTVYSSVKDDADYLYYFGN